MMEDLSIPVMNEDGALILPHVREDAVSVPWHPHPDCDGVYLKDLVMDQGNRGPFRYHLVRVDRGASLGDHVHSNQWEWHMVLDGTGVFRLGEDAIPVKPGQSLRTPPGVHHMITAGDEVLTLCVFFFPNMVRNRYWGMLKGKFSRSG